MSDSSNKVMGTVIKLAVACVIVGFVLQFFEITPERVLENLGETIASLFRAARRFISWASDYFITGALVVLPIWGIAAAMNYIKSKVDGRKK